jgi:cbb3-type cytochrome oxidase maturation protein
VDALYLLIPLSVVLILAIGGLLVWAAMSGQFESLDEEGRRILQEQEGTPPDGSEAGDKPPRSG